MSNICVLFGCILYFSHQAKSPVGQIELTTS